MTIEMIFLTWYAILLLDQSPAMSVIILTKPFVGAVRGAQGTVAVSVTGVSYSISCLGLCLWTESYKVATCQNSKIDSKTCIDQTSQVHTILLQLKKSWVSVKHCHKLMNPTSCVRLLRDDEL